MSDAHIVDTCVFVACGRPDNPKFQRLREVAERRGGTFLIPPRVYEELGGTAGTNSYESVPIDTAISQGWVDVIEPPDYTNSAVSRVMDDTRMYIANETGRSEDSIEKTDTAVVGVALQLLAEGRASRVSLYTGDKPLGGAATRFIPTYGFDAEQIVWIDGHQFVDDLGSQF